MNLAAQLVGKPWSPRRAARAWLELKASPLSVENRIVEALVWAGAVGDGDCHRAQRTDVRSSPEAEQALTSASPQAGRAPRTRINYLVPITRKARGSCSSWKGGLAALS